MAGTRFCNYRAPAMLLDAQLDGGVASAARQATMAERSGFAGVWAAEVTRDPMLALAVAAGSTTRVTVGSNVVLAFARNPMSVAMQAWDLADATAGRFVLGLATQVKPHITRRFSMPWSDPVGRMREFVEALRHIFEVFQGEHPLDFRGQHYSHTLLHGMFNPGPIEHPRIPIGLGGVGPHLTALAGEVADGYLLHAFTNIAYQDAVTLPALERGLAASGRHASRHLGVRLPHAGRRRHRGGAGPRRRSHPRRRSPSTPPARCTARCSTASAAPSSSTTSTSS